MFYEFVVDYFKAYLPNVGNVALVVAIMILSAGALWRALDMFSKFDDSKELFDKENWAYAMQRLAIAFAQIFALLPGALAFDNKDMVRSTLLFVGEALYVSVALIVSRFFVDWVVLPKINNTELMLQGNKAIGIVEAGFYIGIGFLLNGSLTGDASDMTSFWVSTAAFYAAGLAFVGMIFIFHEFVTPYGIREGLKNGHLPSAIETAGIIVATSIVTRIGVAGDFTTWADGFAAFLVTASISVVLMYAARWLIDKVVLTNCTVASIQAENKVVAAMTMAILLVVSALAVSYGVYAQL